jgi:hypothetical protein
MSTAAWAVLRSVKRGSDRSSGSHAGGFAKRANSASGRKASKDTGGKWRSTPTTGTCLGSKLGNLDKGVMRSALVMALWRHQLAIKNRLRFAPGRFCSGCLKALKSAG